MYYDEQKTTQVAVAFMENYNRQKLHYVKLLKLLYITDRESWKTRSCSITEDDYIASDRLLKNTYKVIKKKNHGYWNKYIDYSKGILKVKNDPSDNKLSFFERDLIKSVYKKYGRKTKKELASLCYNFPEWSKKNKPIPYKRILLKVGKSEKEIKKIKEEVQYFRNINKMFS